MLRIAWRFHPACESVCKDFAPPRRVIPGQRLEDDIVAALRVRCPIPRPVEGDEYAVAVVLGELLLVVQSHRVRCPMRREGRDRGDLGRAGSDLLPPIAAVLRRE